MLIRTFTFTPVSMLTNEPQARQRIELLFETDFSGHVILRVQRHDMVLQDTEVAILSGRYHTAILLPPPEIIESAKILIHALGGEKLFETEIVWQPPRKWEMYVMLSSHTDIGLHNSQYIQRHNSANFIDTAMKLIEQTEERPEENRYRYCMEGTWFWNNYALERNRSAAEKVVRDFIKRGKIGVGGGLAGNCTQIYGMEELCRSAYLRNSLKQQWDIDCETMTMIDNNGLSWAIVEPYVKAGYKNLFWAPNHWNPIQSSVYTRDMSVRNGPWNPQACPGGSRCDVRYDSALPMVFYWQGADKQSRLLVWASTQYGSGGIEFGLSRSYTGDEATLPFIEMKMSAQLQKLEKRYPYNIWLLASYHDDEEPNLEICDRIAMWNSKWSWPKLRTLGNMDEPFNRLRASFDSCIPTLCGEITGGWYQLAPCTPEILSKKFAADRALPTAEKITSIAALNACREYPRQSFERAWHALICNDEHSYGVSGYKGRRVYETWMQHRAWIKLAEETATREIEASLAALAANIQCTEPSILVFNPLLHNYLERLEFKDESGNFNECLQEIKPFGYSLVPLSRFIPSLPQETHSQTPPTIKNDFFTVRFAANGSICSITDNSNNVELLDNSDFRANQLLYTDDNHKSFHTTIKATFTIVKSRHSTKVTASSTIPELGAETIQSITLPNYARRIDIDNQILHAKSMVNQNRYNRYIYIAFPFDIKNSRHIVQLNGCIAQAGKDHTGHGTDTYSAAREWVAVENDECGIALIQQDTSLVEFDHIHTDKTDYGANERGSAVFSYIANDWLQMHTPGGSHIDIQCRYSIIKYEGTATAAHIPALAESIVHPPALHLVEPHDGILPPEMNLFGETPENIRLLAMKRADDGDGIIVRIRETHGKTTELPKSMKNFSPCTIDERPLDCDNLTIGPFETKTLRMRGKRLAVQDETPHYRNDGVPEKVGMVYSGLIDAPCAAAGEDDGQLYLLWGQNPEPDVNHYELYRSTEEDFTPSPDNLVATVERGEYCVARHIDTGLAHHTYYYYRVRAVNDSGVAGPFSDVFCGITKE